MSFERIKNFQLFSWLYEICVKAEIILCGRYYNSYPGVYNGTHCRISCLSSVCMTFYIQKKSRYQFQIARRPLTVLDKWHLHVITTYYLRLQGFSYSFHSQAFGFIYRRKRNPNTLTSIDQYHCR